MNSYVIITERLGLRMWLERDIEPLAKMNRDPEVMRYFPRTSNYQETLAMVERIKAGFKKNHFGLYAVEDKLTNEFLGFTGFAIPRIETFFTPCVEIGWRYKKDAWGKGFATEAARACLKLGFETFTFSKVLSFTAALNVKSQNVMKKIGMSYVVDFEHPDIDRQSDLRNHVLYQITPALKK